MVPKVGSTRCTGIELGRMNVCTVGAWKFCGGCSGAWKFGWNRGGSKFVWNGASKTTAGCRKTSGGCGALVGGGVKKTVVDGTVCCVVLKVVVGGSVMGIKRVVGASVVETKRVVGASVMGAWKTLKVAGGSLKTGGFVCLGVVGGCRGVKGLKVVETVTGAGGSRKTVVVVCRSTDVSGDGGGARNVTGSSLALSVD